MSTPNRSDGPLKKSDNRRVRLRAVGFCLAAVGFGRCNLIGLIGIIGFVSRCPSPTGKGAYPHPHQQSAGRQAKGDQGHAHHGSSDRETWCCRRHWCQIGHPARPTERRQVASTNWASKGTSGGTCVFCILHKSKTQNAQQSAEGRVRHALDRLLPALTAIGELSSPVVPSWTETAAMLHDSQDVRRTQ